MNLTTLLKVTILLRLLCNVYYETCFVFLISNKTKMKCLVFELRDFPFDLKKYDEKRLIIIQVSKN